MHHLIVKQGRQRMVTVKLNKMAKMDVGLLFRGIKILSSCVI